MRLEVNGKVFKRLPTPEGSFDCLLCDAQRICTEIHTAYISSGYSGGVCPRRHWVLIENRRELLCLQR